MSLGGVVCVFSLGITVYVSLVMEPKGVEKKIVLNAYIKKNKRIDYKT